MGGAGAIGALAYGVAGARPRPRRPDHRTRQRLRRRGQAAGARATSASTPRPARPRSWSSRMTPRTPARRRRPGQPGRARRAGRRRARHRLAGARATPSPPSVERLAASHPTTPSACAPRSTGSSPRSCSSTRSGARRRVQQRLRARAPRDPDRGARARCSTSSTNAGAIFLGAYVAREPRRLPGRLEPRAAHRRAVAVLFRARRLHVPAPAAGDQLRPGCAARGRRRRSSR